MAVGKWRAFGKALGRKRVFEPEQLEASNLRRCLNLWDLTALGVGSTLGVGVYVLIGSVALHIAGPSIVLSFLIAAIASLFAGLCYAEFGSRVPKAGSAYVYTYVAVGEFVAFIIGWNMILESIFGTASVAKGLSLYVDSMLNKSMSNWFLAATPMNSVHLSPFFDLFSFLAVIILGAVLSLGARESTTVNNVLAAINMLVILFIVVAGSFKADSSNWDIPASAVPEGSGSGGFFPYGVWGTLRGAAICFYGFVGFDAINSTGEEVREPRRVIPVAILTVLSIVFVAYASVSVVVTMMVPYYLQDTVASVATAFSFVGWEWARWVVSVGAVFGISASLFGAMFPLPRLLYSMASDGLLFHWLGRVSSKKKSPAIATLLPTCVIAVTAAILELEQLVMMMCIGTLLSYTIVAACVILLRYRPLEDSPTAGNLKQLVGCGNRAPSNRSSCLVKIVLTIFICVCVSTALVCNHVEESLIALVILHAFCFILLIVIMLQPQANEDLPFKTPLVPIVPCLSIYVNIHLVILINVQTWIRVVIWIAIGIPVYFICSYCYKKSADNLSNNLKTPSHVNKNGKPPVQIIIESPTPPDTIKISSSSGGDRGIIATNSISETRMSTEEEVVRSKISFITEEIIVQQAIVEDNEEKEAKIIDLLDQVLQAEEDSYEDIVSLKEHKEDETKETTASPTDIHRKSLSELSDAGSDASLGNQVLSKYDVIAQIHREDLPKVTEEEEKTEKEYESESNQTEEQEEITEINESETNSRTDESGYSDTLDKNTLNESIEEIKEQASVIPIPPPLDENFFANPTFKKSYTISSRPSKTLLLGEPNKDSQPRLSVQSNSSYDEAPMVFGSDKQMDFMSRLNTIFLTKISSTNDTNENDEKRKRSHSAGNLADSAEYSSNRERPQMFLDLKKEIEASRGILQDECDKKEEIKTQTEAEPDKEDEEDTSLSREDLKLKLENIFAAGGPRLLKPRVVQSNPPTPEECYHTDTSSAESISRIPKVEKNDTLKRQKDKFNEVLNSIRLSVNKADDV
ncbi:high affinity cationic amino acid transporter 1-like [Battus philenor]|uniref:high affinity cationic amino acid transporter 1-like n=1 Tax=Battus philenor TaxID=42288 RepID=UPI0035D00DE7